MVNWQERFTAWKTLEKILMVCLFVDMALWWVLLGTVCSEPWEPNVTTHHTVPFNCHGTLVFITPLRDAFLRWLMPVFLVVGLAWTAAHKRVNKQSERFKRT